MRTRPKKKMTGVVHVGTGRVKVEHDGGEYRYQALRQTIK